MNEKQRVKASVRFEKTDVVPWQINYTKQLGNALMETLGLEPDRHEVLGENLYHFNRLDDYLGNHIAYLRNRAVDSVWEIRPDHFQDEWGVVWDRTVDKEVGVPTNILLEKADAAALRGLEVPNPADERRYAHFEPIIGANRHRYLLVRFSFCLFERAWTLRGMQNLMMDFSEQPAFVHDLLDRITEFNLAVLERAATFGVDGAFFPDDWASQRGMLMHPDTWREFIKPRQKRLYRRAYELELDVFIHSCGDVRAILDDLVQMGVNVFNPLQPEVMDVESVMGRYAGKLGFYGGLSIQQTLPYGTTGDVRHEVEHRLGLARIHRGYIVAPSHEMPPDVPLENVLAMREIFVNQNGR